MNADVLIPVRGCWVRRSDGPLGRVVDHRVGSDGAVQMQVAWRESAREWVPLLDLRCGFRDNWTVQDVPLSATRRSLGQGRVVGMRSLGGREQLLVQIDDTGHSVWLPYENLRRVKDVRLRYVRAESGHRDHAARYRLKVLAHALENWNHLTGSLDRLDVDPLPHQIQLVHRILTSGNYNWLIADDGQEAGGGAGQDDRSRSSARRAEATRIRSARPHCLPRWPDSPWKKSANSGDPI